MANRRARNIGTRKFKKPLTDHGYRIIADAVNDMCGTDYKSKNMRGVGPLNISYMADNKSTPTDYIVVFLNGDNGTYGNCLSKKANTDEYDKKYLLERFDHTKPGHERATFLKQKGTYNFLGMYQYVEDFIIDDKKWALWERTKDWFDDLTK